MSSDVFYVTTPIYYVNDKPHIGHAYTTILADVLARYNRLLGCPTFFLTGTDEHGQKVQQAAIKNGISPQQHCDDTVVRFQELWEKLEITHDDFIRTTEPRHKQVVQGALQDLYDRDEIYRADYDGWYCVTCERFFTEKDLVDGKCPEPGCNRAVERIRESNYFFRMSKYQDWLIQHITDNPTFIQPDFRRNETLGFLRKPLGDLCISRPKSRLAWGIELPFDADFVTYVWFDALVNYISAIGYPGDMESFRKWWPASYHLIGKDILTTHTVYWPTMLKAMGVELPQAVFAHGWWLAGQSKMSKSAGNVVNPMTMAETYGVDPFRYFLMAEMTLGQDASFTEQAFVKRYNADLANDLGNLASRVIKMVRRDLDGSFPSACSAGPDEQDLVDATLGAVGHMESYLSAMQLDRALSEVQAAVREGNRYFDKMAPWALAKQGDREALARTLYSGAECLRIVSGLLYPVMPEKMAELRRALGLAGDELEPNVARLSTWGNLPTGRPLDDIKALFPRVDTKKTAQPKPKQKKAKKKTQAVVELIDIEDFSKVTMKTAKVLEAAVVPDSERLLKLQVQIGAQQRQIVAGIAKYYAPDDLIGSTVVVVANLKPAKLMGVESNGMLLAAKSGKALKLVTVDGELPTGASVG
ncbi:MAG: methionine--tRNA ligase [Lentisphaerae bacterium]|jgi:methionyl-tRNA synthetase|nr:methionine--tRNA ligase [Lentisphaerota bacterium]MBT4818203.1 methionine--tRNA ligase [Lentisphaerota bacterium]MBT5608033.1 methionine--tRNA ligase [Lentisphaerota bacterium]MBT7056499.1 methionine--tRNA ligase [Lentisphaerota bacterium]MBT7840730.1 methionine--tRNA ligase [Lentisphaerota bacterium]